MESKPVYTFLKRNKFSFNVHMQMACITWFIVLLTYPIIFLADSHQKLLSSCGSILAKLFNLTWNCGSFRCIIVISLEFGLFIIIIIILKVFSKFKQVDPYILFRLTPSAINQANETNLYLKNAARLFITSTF